MLEDIRMAIGLGDHAFRDFLDLDEPQFQRVRRGQALLPHDTAELLCSRLGLSLEALTASRIDYSELALKFCGKVLELPERYRVPGQQLTRARSIQGIMEYTRLLRGDTFVRKTFGSLGLHASLFDDPESFVSPLVGDDVLSFLHKSEFTDFQIREMGAMTLVTNHANSVGRTLSAMQTASQLYEELHEVHINKFDRIWTYRLLALDAHGCTAEIRVREEMSDVFKDNPPGSRRMCLFRQGVYASVLGNIQKRLARLTESECLYLGGQRCVYHLRWDGDAD